MKVKFRSLRWLKESAVGATVLGAVFAPLSWQFGLGIIISAWITYADAIYGSLGKEEIPPNP